jgi:hypothetical protein
MIKMPKKIWKKDLIKILLILFLMFAGLIAVENLTFYFISLYYQQRIADLRDEVVVEYPFTPRKLTDWERKEFEKGNVFHWDCPSGDIERNFYYEKGILEERSVNISFPASIYEVFASKDKYEYFLGLKKQGKKVTILPPDYGPSDEECPERWKLFVFWVD